MQINNSLANKAQSNNIAERSNTSYQEDTSLLDNLLLSTQNEITAVKDITIGIKSIEEEETIIQLANTIKSKMESDGFFNGLSEEDVHIAKINIPGVVDKMYSIYFAHRDNMPKPDIFYLMLNNKYFKNMIEGLGLKINKKEDKEQLEKLGKIFADVALKDIYKTKGFHDSTKWLEFEFGMALGHLVLKNPDSLFNAEERKAIKTSLDTLLRDADASQEEIDTAREILKASVNKAKDANLAGGIQQGFNNTRIDLILDYIFDFADKQNG